MPGVVGTAEYPKYTDAEDLRLEGIYAQERYPVDPYRRVRRIAGDVPSLWRRLRVL
jgi:hypothetical protein